MILGESTIRKIGDPQSSLADFNEGGEIKPVIGKFLSAADASNQLGMPASKEVDSGNKVDLPPVDQSEIGHFAVTNGTVGFVSSNGLRYIGPATDENLVALEAAGYVRGSVYVPHAAGSNLTPLYEFLQQVTI